MKTIREHNTSTGITSFKTIPGFPVDDEGNLLLFPFGGVNTDPSILRVSRPVDSQYSNTSPNVSFSIRQGSRGGPVITFEETGAKQRERDRLRVELKIRQDADFSGVDTYLPPLPGINDPAYTTIYAGGILMNRLALEVAPRILHVLEAIWQDAATWLTINSHRIEYTKTAWTKAVKTMKKGLSGKVSIPRLLDLQSIAMADHRQGLSDYEAAREKTNQAPVSREIANTSRLYQAAERGLSIELDGMKITSPTEDWKAIQAAIQEAQANGATDQVFAAAALQSEDYSGLEIPALVNLIQIVREKAGLAKSNGAIQNKLDALVINPDEFMARLCLIKPNTSGTQKAREKARLSGALTSLARKMIKIAPQKKDASTRVAIKGFRTGFFMFEEISANSGEAEAGSWKFTALDLIQILTDDDMPFRPIPTDPFNYIVQESDVRYMDDILRAAWDILLALSFAPASKQTISLSRFNLTSGDGIPHDLAQIKQNILIHALERYTKGIAKIENGILEYTPPTTDKPISINMEAGIKKIAESTARKAARGEIRKAGKKRT
jgi:hypothetical protein